MFVFIRRHQTIGLIFIFLVIISFVVFFSAPNPFSDEGKVDYGSIEGRPITRDEFLEARSEARLEYLLRYGRWPDSDSRDGEMERETMNRLFLMGKLKDLQVEVSDQAIANRIADYPFLHDQGTGKFDPQLYDRFIQSTLVPQGYTKDDFQRFAEHEVAIENLVPLAGLPGELVTPREAEKAFREDHQQLVTEIVLFPASNYVAQVKLDPAELGDFFTNRQAAYRIAERAQVSYVKFDVTNHLAEADQELAKMTNMSRILDNFYISKGTNTFRDDAGNVLPPEAAKEKIKEQFRTELALRTARKKANEFASELFEQATKEPPSEFMEKLAAAKGYVSSTTEPFTEFAPPTALKVPSTFGQNAFKLTTEEPFGGPITGEDGVYIIALKNRVPSSVPEMDSIRARVTDDFLTHRSRELARQAGTNFFDTLTNKLAQGQNFQQIATEAGVAPIKLPPISRKTQNLTELEGRISIGELKNVAFTLPAGKTNTFSPSGSGGLVLQISEKLPVTETDLKAELPGYMNEIRDRRQYAAFSEWFRKELQQARVTLPGNRKAVE